MLPVTSTLPVLNPILAPVPELPVSRILPERISFPPVAAIRTVWLLSVPEPAIEMFPAHVFVPLTLLSRAEPDVPIAAENVSPLTVMPPWSCSVASAVTTVPAAVLPSAVAFWMLRTPALTVVVSE